MGAYLKRGGQGRKEHGEGRKWEEERSAPFPSSSAVTAGHDNKLNENHRLDSDLSTYNKLGGITLCITEMATH